MNEIPTTDEVVYEPDPAFAESTNVRRFMESAARYRRPTPARTSAT
jgi:hypothetical protein